MIVVVSEEILWLKNLLFYVWYLFNRSIGEVFLNLVDFDNVKKYFKFV